MRRKVKILFDNKLINGVIRDKILKLEDLKELKEDIAIVLGHLMEDDYKIPRNMIIVPYTVKTYLLNRKALSIYCSTILDYILKHTYEKRDIDVKEIYDNYKWNGKILVDFKEWCRTVIYNNKIVKVGEDLVETRVFDWFGEKGLVKVVFLEKCVYLEPLCDSTCFIPMLISALRDIKDLKKPIIVKTFPWISEGYEMRLLVERDIVHLTVCVGSILSFKDVVEYKLKKLLSEDIDVNLTVDDNVKLQVNVGVYTVELTFPKHIFIMFLLGLTDLNDPLTLSCIKDRVSNVKGFKVLERVVRRLSFPLFYPYPLVTLK